MKARRKPKKFTKKSLTKKLAKRSRVPVKKRASRRPIQGRRAILSVNGKVVLVTDDIEFKTAAHFGYNYTPRSAIFTDDGILVDPVVAAAWATEPFRSSFSYNYKLAS